MKKKILAVILTLPLFAIIYQSDSNTSGPSGGLTNAPSEGNCTSCHTGSLTTSGYRWSRIKLNANWTGNGYIPDSTYDIRITYKDTQRTKFGFQLVCLDVNTNRTQGTFTTTDSRTQTFTATVAGNSRGYIGHTSTGTTTTGTDSTTWNIKWRAPNSNVGNVRFYITLNSTDAGSGTSGDVVYAKTFTISPSTLLPTCDIKFNDTNQCTGSPITFNHNTTGSPTSYSWSFPSGSPPVSTATNPNVTYSTTGNYMAILRVKNNKGFSLPDTHRFTVKQGASLPVITPGGTRTVCRGDSLRLSATFFNNYTYAWTPVNKTGISIFAKDTGLYRVVGRAPNGCSRTSAAVRILIGEFANFSWIRNEPRDTYCVGEDIFVSMLNLNNADSFATSIDGLNKFSKIKDFNLKQSTTGNFSITGVAKSIANCASATKTYNYVVVNFAAAPTLTISNRTYTGFTVNWNSIAGAKGYQISRDTGKTWQTPSSGNLGLSHSVSGLSPGMSRTVWVRAENNTSCKYTATANVLGSTLPCPDLSYTVSGDTVVCPGNEPVITLKGLGTKNYRVLIDGVSKGKDTVLTIKNLTQFKNSVQITVVDSQAIGCATFNKTVNFNLVSFSVGIETNNKIQICKAQSSAATINYIPTSNADSIQLVKNGAVQGAYRANSPWNYSVQHQDSIHFNLKRNKCTSIAGGKKILMTGALDLGFSNSVNNYNYTFNPNETAGSHTWIIDTIVRKSTAPTVNLAAYKGKQINIKHIIEKDIYCKDSASTQFNINDLGLYKVMSSDIRVFPNPAKSELFLQFLNFVPKGTIQLTDAQGKIVRSVIADNKSLQRIELTGLNTGVYFIQLTGDSYSQAVRVVIQN